MHPIVQSTNSCSCFVYNFVHIVKFFLIFNYLNLNMSEYTKFKGGKLRLKGGLKRYFVIPSFLCCNVNLYRELVFKLSSY